ncbi:MAG: HD domain-containing protein [Chthoniobacterales bacterium]|nr:HD domain-containing protein [Chthoniobacterales bacterium]
MPNQRLFLRDCASGDCIDDVYVITQKQLAATATGKFFIKAFVSDRSQQLNARMWNATREIFASIPDSGYIRIRGRIENYQNNLQLIIEGIQAVKEGTFDIGELLPQTEKDIAEMCRKIHELCGSIQNRHLAALVQCYLDDEKLMADFCKAPAAQGFHHAFIGGLLEHTLNAMEVADAIVKFYPGLSRDLLLAGIFLHDIAKTWELKYDSAFGYTDGGQLVGHIVKSAMWVEHKAKEAESLLGEPIPQPLIDVLQHIILSHHGEPEFGAARVPSTPEAIAVHVIENFDAKMMMALSATRGHNVSEGNWTEYMKAFSGKLYRPDVALADGVEHETPQAPETRSNQPALAPASALAPAPRRDEAPLDLKAAISNPLFETVPKHRS